MNEAYIRDNQADFLLYTGNDGEVNVEVVLKDETVWLTQKTMAAMYGVQRPAITKHLKNIFDSGELDKDSVSSILEHTADDGKRYKTKFYNLDAIISVGYRVNSYQTTQFRIWATKTLKEYIIKVFVLDDNKHKRNLSKLDNFPAKHCYHYPYNHNIAPDINIEGVVKYG